MELSSPESIAALLNMTAPRAPARARGALLVSPSPRKDRKVRCRCGHCCQCMENARWERIFEEKFSDPDYYTWRGVQHVSPLTSL
jgi:hypothetical protein